MPAILPAKARQLLLLVMLTLLTLTGGCGLKGELYLPDPEPASTTRAEPGPAGDDPAATPEARDKDATNDDGAR